MTSVGDRIKPCRHATGGKSLAEIVGFRGGVAQALPFGAADGLGPGKAKQWCSGHGGSLAVADTWLGRVIDPLGNPLDRRGRLPPGPLRRQVRAAPPMATDRARLGPRIDLGVRALDLVFTTCRQGQRLGLFAGSGVGKSTLLSAMLARQADCDVAVLALVGERGREGAGVP